MLTQGRQVLRAELAVGTRRQAALQHHLEVDQLRGLLIVAHYRGHRVPPLGDERPAGPSPTPFEQTVLAHRLQRPAHGDLADTERLRNHTSVSEPVDRKST